MDSGNTLTLFGGKRKRSRPSETKDGTHPTPLDQGIASSTLTSSSSSSTSISTTLSSSGKKEKKSEKSSSSSSSSSSSPDDLFNSTTIIPPHTVEHYPNFLSLGIKPWLIKSINAMGITQPTLIQQASILPILKGYDMIGLAQTGTGKTAAFALPILQKLSEDPYGIYAVILTPSRELAYQITDQFNAFGAALGTITVCTVTGGMDMVNQAQTLRKQPHIVVATPGRLAYHIKQSATPPDLSKLAFIVFDECDRLLDDSFTPDVQVILNAIQRPSLTGTRTVPSRQTLLFSATLTADMRSRTVLERLGLRVGNEALRIFDGSSSPWSTVGNAEEEEEEDEEEGIDDDDDEENNEGISPDGTTATKTKALLNHALLAPLTVPNLRQEYLFVPAAVKNAYLWETLLTLGPRDLSVTTSSHGKSSSSASSSSSKKHKNNGSNDTAGDFVTGTRALTSSGNDDESSLHRSRSIIIFTSTCRSAELVCEMCIELGIPATALHSAMPQVKRLASLAKFKGSIVRVLVATDVASRGLDIPMVDLVINYDVPRTPTDYVHRVGRTARAGRGGYAVTIITQYEVTLVQTIEQTVLGGKKLAKVSDNLIGEDEVLKKLTKVATALHLARSRLADKGFDELLRVRKARKFEAKAERETMKNNE